MGKSLIEILKAAGIDVEEVSRQVLEGALNLEGHIPSGKQPDEQPEVVVTIQDNNSKEPWEVKQMAGEMAMVIVHKGEGVVEASIVGSVSSPIDFIVLAEACNNMKKNILKKGMEYALDRIKGE